MQQYYNHAGITIYHGDCRDLVPFDLLNAALVVTDIPYNISQKHGGLREIDYGGWDKQFDHKPLVEWFWSIRTSYIWCAKEQLADLLTGFRERGLIDKSLAWIKPNPNPMNGQHHWLEAFEVCCFAKQPGALFTAHCKPGVWTCPPDEPRLHPNQKPLDVIRQQILASSEVGDTVLDPYMGSGTTLRAAKDLGRKAVGIEINEKHCEVAARRCDQEVLPLF